MISNTDIEITNNVLNILFNHRLQNKMSIVDLKKISKIGKIVENCQKICSLKQPKIKKSLENSNTSKQLMCYICKQKITQREFNMCEVCKNNNFVKRSIKANLNDKVSIVTGGRVKIGFETAIRLLECGSKVIVTTRFPADALTRYKLHPEYKSFYKNLTIYAIDLRYMADINKFVEYVYTNFNRLDILIHNAAQTLRRPKEFFKHLLSNELGIANHYLDEHVDSLNCKQLTKSYTRFLIADQTTNLSINQMIVLNDRPLKFMKKVFNALTDSDDPTLFPVGQYDSNHEQIDLRKENTWVKKLGEIDITECAELLSINTLAPFHMNQQFKTLMSKSSGSYIVNVSSMEGVFNMTSKTSNHPHTNMAKCALNMMTRTSACTYAKDKIYMVSVDTGWVTNEYPIANDCHDKKHKIRVPLDNLDGACRILDPVFKYFNGEKPIYGVFLKDYVESNW